MPDAILARRDYQRPGYFWSRVMLTVYTRLRSSTTTNGFQIVPAADMIVCDASLRDTGSCVMKGRQCPSLRFAAHMRLLVLLLQKRNMN